MNAQIPKGQANKLAAFSPLKQGPATSQGRGETAETPFNSHELPRNEPQKFEKSSKRWVGKNTCLTKMIYTAPKTH